MTISIAVLSDLHCHGPNDPVESHLIAGAPRVPIENHPIQSLVKLAKEKDIKAQVILCCGDLANKASQQGLSHVWDLLRSELKPAFDAKMILSTIGNHDVASHSLSGSPFEVAQTIHPNFPFNEEDNNTRFWADGFCLQKVEGTSDFLIINTAHNHWNEEAAKSGTFSLRSIKALDTYLTKIPKAPIRIAAFHHHPIPHPSMITTSKDILSTGADLIAVLVKHNFQFLIHGHRHEPSISRHSIDGKNLHILCAGSFSVFLNDLGTITRNLFHLVELSFQSGSTWELIGNIKTWEFNKGVGWNPSTVPSARFRHNILIGAPSNSNIVQKITKDFRAKNVPCILGEEIKKVFPYLNSPLPGELDAIEEQLVKEGLKMDISESGLLSGIWRTYDLSKRR